MARHALDRRPFRRKVARIVVVTGVLLGISWTVGTASWQDVLPPGEPLPTFAMVTTSPVTSTPTTVATLPPTTTTHRHVVKAPKTHSAPTTTPRAAVRMDAYTAPTTTPRRTTTPRPATTMPRPPAQVPRAPIARAPVAPPAPVVPATPSHSALVGIARSFIGRGIPYLYGGKDPAVGLDCSGFIWVVLKQGGYNVPYRSSGALAAWATPISASQAVPGDLVFWPGHAGIYAGGGTVIDDGTSAGPKVTTIWGSPTYGRIPL